MINFKVLKNIVKKTIPFRQNLTPREILARRYLKGDGIEIGALHLPSKIPSCARVKYLDRLSADELRSQYPELKNSPFVRVDIIDDGESLRKVRDNSQDFVIANHFLEHCENPIRAIESFLRVLKDGGILYLAVPDKRFTFDKERKLTPLEHLLKDYQEGAEWSRQEHFQDWKVLAENESKNNPAVDIKIVTDEHYSIHYHVWTYFELLELLVFLKNNLNFRFEVLEFVFSGAEAIFIIKKTT